MTLSSTMWYVERINFHPQIVTRTWQTPLRTSLFQRQSPSDVIESGTDGNSLLADLSVECRSCMSTFEPLGNTQVLD